MNDSYNVVILKNQVQLQEPTLPSPSTTIEQTPYTHKYYDLHLTHKQSPLIDTETLTFIPTRWTIPNHIPDTFPILPGKIST